MESMETQCARAMKMINTRSTDIDKYLYLSNLKATNTDLFYRLLMDNVRQLMPLVYTPTIGDVCLQYSTLYSRPEALYISIKQRKSIATILRNWPYPNPSICVVTDGSRILGLGDLGANGVGISVSSQIAAHVLWTELKWPKSAFRPSGSTVWSAKYWDSSESLFPRNLETLHWYHSIWHRNSNPTRLP